MNGFVSLSVALPIFFNTAALTAAAATVTVDPTLLSSTQPTLVTASISNGRFYTGPTPPPVRIAVTQSGTNLQQVQPASITPTEVTYLFPRLDPGLYGFAIRAQDTNTHTWVTVYESSPRFFRVDPDIHFARVFNTFEPTLPQYQTHPWEFLNVTQCVVSGVISGSVAAGHNVSGNAVDLQWLKDFRWDGEGDCGIIFRIDCDLEGYAMFHYSIPFEMTIVLPQTVYAGQRVNLTPRSIRYAGGDAVSCDHNLDFSTCHRLMLNVPYDTLPPLNLELRQLPDRLRVGGTLPLGPWLDYTIDPPLEVGGPFDDGQAAFDGIELVLGGHTSYMTSGQAVDTAYGLRTISTAETQLPALWSISGNVFALLSHIPIPYVQTAAAVLATADVEISPALAVDVKSRDLVSLDSPSFSELYIEAPQSSGPWQKTFQFPIQGKLWSSFIYELAADVVFDMPFIDAQPLGEWNLEPIYYAALPQANTFTATATLNTTVEVLPAATWHQTYAPTATGNVDLANYTIQQATNERIRIANLVFTNPPRPATVSTTNSGTFPTKPGCELALMAACNPPGAGTVTLNPPPVDGGYATGAVISVTAQAANGYRFTGWTGDAVGSANPITVVMTDIKNLTATFAAVLSSEVLAAGDNSSGATQIPAGLSNAVAVAAGSGFSSALKSDGTVVSWGSATYGETNVPAGLSNVVAIASGWSHTLALCKEGSIVGWGAGTNIGQYPQLGQALIPGGLSNIVAIAGGATHSVALDALGRVSAWGGRGFGETNIPPDLPEVAAIDAGNDFTLALQRNGKVVAWGTSAYGAAAPPQDLTNAVAVAAGWYHALALKDDGTVAAWGAGGINSGTFPQLGQGMVPAGLSNVIAIAAGNTFSLALKRDGTLAAWGSYFSAGSYIPISIPSTASNLTAIAAGGDHYVALINGPGTPKALRNPSMKAGAFSVSVLTERGEAFFLEFKNSLADPSWTIRPPVYGDSTVRQLADYPGTSAQRFYRVRNQ